MYFRTTLFYYYSYTIKVTCLAIMCEKLGLVSHMELLALYTEHVIIIGGNGVAIHNLL